MDWEYDHNNKKLLFKEVHEQNAHSYCDGCRQWYKGIESSDLEAHKASCKKGKKDKQPASSQRPATTQSTAPQPNMPPTDPSRGSISRARGGMSTSRYSKAGSNQGREAPPEATPLAQGTWGAQTQYQKKSAGDASAGMKTGGLMGKTNPYSNVSPATPVEKTPSTQATWGTQTQYQKKPAADSVAGMKPGGLRGQTNPYDK
jgi:hypothetical protein